MPAPAQARAGFAYVAMVRQFPAFMRGYRGLALGGIARNSQTQLLLPFLTPGACALWLGEAVVAGSLWVRQRTPVRGA